jgi:hypothetical protein
MRSSLGKPEKVDQKIISILAHKIILAKSLASLVYQTQVSCVGVGEVACWFRLLFLTCPRYPPRAERNLWPAIQRYISPHHRHPRHFPCLRVLVSRQFLPAVCYWLVGASVSSERRQLFCWPFPVRPFSADLTRLTLDRPSDPRPIFFWCVISVRPFSAV